jgi:cell division protein FtsB
VDTTAWLTLAGVVVAVAAVAAPLALRRGDRLRARLERLEAENQALRDTNVELKIQVGLLRRTADVVDRTFAGLLEQKTPEESA